MSRQRVHPAPFAMTVDGSLIANVQGYTGETNPELLLRRALKDGRQVFIGTRLDAAEPRQILARLQEPCHEMAGLALGAREGRRGKRAVRRARPELPVPKRSS